MKRRDFIKRSAPIVAVPFFMNGFRLKAYADASALRTLVNAADCTDHVFVLIQMNGGNDGLNMVLPLDQYPAIMAARANIAIPENQALKFNLKTGIHPAMTGIKSLYDNAKLCVVQSVGYPTPNFSHFRSTDIWLTASDYDQYISTGWLGRFLEKEYVGFPNGYPNTIMPDPIAIQIGSVISISLEGHGSNMGMVFSDPNTFYNIVNYAASMPANTRMERELSYVKKIGNQIQDFATPVKTAAGKATNKSTLYPAAGKNMLSDQLKIVAQLIAGGLKTRIYVVNIGGGTDTKYDFDTHASQAVAGAAITGNHATLLKNLADAIQAFQDDLRLLNLEDRVVGMTFSEFGRRIKSNSGLGTDHGAAAPLFVFGKNVQPGIVGANPILPANATVDDNVPMQFDFRSVYASILKDWFCVPTTDLKNLLFKDFQILPIIKGNATAVDDVQPSSIALYQNYPNPFNLSTRIKFLSDADHVRISVFDKMGREIQTIVDGKYSTGEHEVVFDASGLPSGTYYCRMQSGNYQQMKSMVLVK